MAEPWDIPDPCHFEPCAPEPCGPCDAGSIFQHRASVPGVPYGRKIVPLVRVNGQIQDLNAGAFIQNGYLEPPSLSWNPSLEILEVGGRFIKLTGVGSMMYSDCHGHPINPCLPIMSCGNFAEIIGASTGVGFKTPSNPFAGLTVVLGANSGLVVDNGGLRIDWAALCTYIANNCGGVQPTPTPTGTGTNTPTPTGTGTGTPTPTPTPTGTNPTMLRTGIPLYNCRANDNTSVGEVNGTTSIIWDTVTGSIAATGIFNPGVGYLFSGSAGAANLIGLTSSSGYTLAQFNAITMVSKSAVCGATSTPTPTPTPTGTGTPTPTPTPTPVLSKVVSVANGQGCGMHNATAVFNPGAGTVTITEDRSTWTGVSTAWQGYANLNAGSPTGPVGSSLSATNITTLQGGGFTQGMFDLIAAFQGTDDCTGQGG